MNNFQNHLFTFTFYRKALNVKQSLPFLSNLLQERNKVCLPQSQKEVYLFIFFLVCFQLLQFQKKGHGRMLTFQPKGIRQGGTKAYAYLFIHVTFFYFLASSHHKRNLEKEKKITKEDIYMENSLRVVCRKLGMVVYSHNYCFLWCVCTASLPFFPIFR